ncbi:MAG: hypothetical protein AAFU84_09350 [Cyanobacteria bacterium J06633_23]
MKPLNVGLGNGDIALGKGGNIHSIWGLFEEIAAAGLKDIWENAAVPAPVVLANRLDLTLVMLPLLIWG